MRCEIPQPQQQLIPSYDPTPEVAATTRTCRLG